jgi:hypothetical protein
MFCQSPIILNSHLPPIYKDTIKAEIRSKALLSLSIIGRVKDDPKRIHVFGFCLDEVCLVAVILGPCISLCVTVNFDSGRGCRCCRQQQHCRMRGCGCIHGCQCMSGQEVVAMLSGAWTLM